MLHHETKFIHFVLHFVAGGEKMVLFQKCWHVQTEGKIKWAAASSLFPDQTSSPRAPAASSSSDIPRHKSWLVTSFRGWRGQAAASSWLCWASQRSPTLWPQYSGLMPQETQCLSEWVFICPQQLNRESVWSWNKIIQLKIIVSNHSLQSITLKFLQMRIFHSQILHPLFLKE